MGQTVLCFQLSKEKEQAVGDVCRKLGIRQRKVTGGEYNQKLGFLAGIDGFNKEPGASVKGALSGEMLVFSGISGCLQRDGDCACWFESDIDTS